MCSACSRQAMTRYGETQWAPFGSIWLHLARALYGVVQVVPGFRRHMSNSRIGFRVVALMATLVVVWLMSAQTFRGCITGIVSDESKAVVAGANVRLTNVGFACLAMLGSAHEEKL